MSADLTLRKPDSLDQCLYRIEFQGCQPEFCGNPVHHSPVFRSGRIRILLGIFVPVTLELLDYPPCYQFHVGFARGESEERASVDKRRASDAHVHLLCAVVKENLHVVAQLSAPYY